MRERERGEGGEEEGVDKAVTTAAMLVVMTTAAESR